ATQAPFCVLKGSRQPYTPGERDSQSLTSASRPPSRPVIEGFREWAAQLPETIGLFVTSGAHDFLIHVAVSDTNGLYAFVIDRLTERREVADVQSTMVYEHAQSRCIDPAPAERPAPSRRRR
ncbi:Lrp/AsnC ligand binding domain-containing protein, partial [Streptomyces sp. NPDC020125]|uniref:Lrp/AsnC ligand binding domain-containing protein n=1 Tax=Streptomyces sp. NPDC020125 TaxID=3154593 RepID=UPI0033D56F36